MNHDDVSRKLDEIEAELSQLGLFAPPGAESLTVDAAFGGATMAFEQWLAQVFLPAARNAVAARDFPQTSQVGVAAARNFDGQDDMNDLAALLSEFDHMVETIARHNTQK